MPSSNVMIKAARLIIADSVKECTTARVYTIYGDSGKLHVITLINGSHGPAYCTCRFGRETGEQTYDANRQCIDVVAAREIADRASRQ